MAYELSAWQFDANRAYDPTSAPDLTKYQMWYLATFLMCGPGMASYQNGANGCWTYEGSSDGVTGDMSTNIANFKWGTVGTYDGSKIVQVTLNPATTPHSWIVLKSPLRPDGGFTYLLIEAYFTSTAGYGVCHSNNPWLLAGTPTFTPTTTNPTPAPTTSGAVQTNDGATVTGQWFNGCLASNGNFVVFDGIQGSGYMQHAVVWANAFNYQTSPFVDTYPYFFYHNYKTTPGPGAFRMAEFNGTNPAMAARNFQTSMGFNVNPLAYSNFNGFATRDQGNALLTTRLPFWVWWSNGTGSIHARGRLQDLSTIIADSFYASAVGNGYLWREGGAIKYVSLGVWVIPWGSELFL